MRDSDTKILEEKYESLFSGKIEEEEDTSLDAIQDKDDDKEEEKDEEKSEDSEESKDEDSSDDDSDDSDDSEDSEKSDDDDDSEEADSDSEDSDDSNSSAGGDAGIQSKVKQLQKQYNDLLVDAFEKYAAECIENALDGVDSSFGENIQDILDSALQELKGKILGDLGVEDAMAPCPMAGGEMGGMEVDLGDKPDVEFGAEVGGIPTITVDTDDEAPEDDVEAEEDEEKEDEVEEACGAKKKGKKIMKESTLAAEFYGFV